MKKLKHNKLRNTGLLFEILSKNVMHEVINNPTKTPSLSIIKAYFKPGSELLKELNLYQTLSGSTNNNPNELFDLTLDSKRKLDESKLESEKYALIKAIKKHYELNAFFDSRIANYKLTASIYKLLEFNNSGLNPDDYLTSKKLVTEHLSGKKSEIEDQQFEDEWREQDPDVRKLGFKFIVEKFNEKYRTLGTRQKALLSKYINEDPSNPTFKNYVLKEIGWINGRIDQLSEKVQDTIMKIKLTEVVNLTQKIISAKQVKDEHLSSMLKYYELIESLESENE